MTADENVSGEPKHELLLNYLMWGLRTVNTFGMKEGQ